MKNGTQLILVPLSESGGEGGIRTLDTLPYTHFPGVLLQPLGHLTVRWTLRLNGALL